MKNLTKLSIILLLISSIAFGQAGSGETTKRNLADRKLTIEPGIGITLYPMPGLLVSNLLQWNINKRLNIVSYTSYSYNNAFLRDFNFIETNYDYSLGQKFGIGTSRYTKHSSHTLSLMGGIKYDTFKETLNNPEFEKVTVLVKSVSPDVGLMYNLKIGTKKYFFSYRMYIPLYPYPFKSSDINSIDGNLANVSMEFGFGIRLK
jgi:hypothetical protein